MRYNLSIYYASDDSNKLKEAYNYLIKINKLFQLINIKVNDNFSEIHIYENLNLDSKPDISLYQEIADKFQIDFYYLLASDETFESNDFNKRYFNYKWCVLSSDEDGTFDMSFYKENQGYDLSDHISDLEEDGINVKVIPITLKK